MSRSTDYDVAVIGGGVIGLSIAWRLRECDLSVAVVDPAPAAAASHAAAGMLAPVSEVRYGEEHLLALGLASLRRYPTFVAELEGRSGQRVGLRQDGTLIVATDAGDRAALAELHDFQVSLGLDATLLTSRECRSLEPSLSPEVRSGLLAASDHSINNRRLAAALVSVARTCDIRLLTTRVTAVELAEPGPQRVDCEDGTRLIADTVVLAAGPWSASIAGVPAQAVPPVRPVKGEILRLQVRPGCPVPGHSVRGLVNGREIYLVPRLDGELVVGATVEEMGFDTVVRVGAVREMLRDAHQICPGVDELALTECIAALRPGSPDNVPLIGWTTAPGLLVATGHHRNGILLAPITADLVADLVTGVDRAGELLELVSPRRFSAVGT